MSHKKQEVLSFTVKSTNWPQTHLGPSLIYWRIVPEDNPVNTFRNPQTPGKLCAISSVSSDASQISSSYAIDINMILHKLFLIFCGFPSECTWRVISGAIHRRSTVKHKTFITVRNSSVGKVMFSQASVNLFTGNRMSLVPGPSWSLVPCPFRARVSGGEYTSFPWKDYLLEELPLEGLPHPP